MVEQRAILMEPLSVAKCPLCSVGEPSTLDHYVPKSQHPEFAVFSKNLVPCCSTCNNHKGELFVENGSDIRLFLHPYYDAIPDVPFLALDVRLMHDAIVLDYHLIQTPLIGEETV